MTLGNVKDVVAIVKESVILLVILVVLCFPRQTITALAKLGFGKIETPIGDIDTAEYLKAAAAVEAARSGVTDAAAAVQAVLGTVEGTARTQLTEVADGLRTTAASLNQPEQVLATAAKKQPLAGAEPTLEGWMFVGHADEAKRAWAPASEIVSAPTPLFEPGQTVRVTKDVYLRGSSRTGDRNAGPVVGVVHAGEDVRVLEVGYTHALRGGWFVWVRAARN